MSLCGRYVLFPQTAVAKGMGRVLRAGNTPSKKSQQHCYGCLSRRQGVPWSCTARTIFSFFNSGKNRPKEPKPDMPLPTYRIIHKLGRVSPRRKVPDHIAKPEWAATGIVPKKPIHPPILGLEGQDEMRAAGKIARTILDLAAAELRVGVTTDYIDEVVHNACIEHKVYPSTLNYHGFPKSLCTSINNVMVHGIPDDRPLHDRDIINLDITIYQNGFHADLSETYLIGDVDSAAKHLVEVSRRCRDEAIRQCKPYEKISVIGKRIEEICDAEGLTLCRGFDGHGIGTHFHCKPHIWHYRNNYPEIMEPGMAFTIEPVILEHPDNTCKADDDWTMFAENHTRSAQFEHTILITNTGCEVLTAGKNEDYSDADKLDDQNEDDIIQKQSTSSSNWSFK